MKAGEVEPRDAMNSPTLLLMLKAPVEGQVKTRLGREIGMRAAALVYRRLVEHQMRQSPPGWPVHVCFTPAEAETTMRAWLGESCEYSAQVSGDLGQRLTEAATRHFQQHESPLVIIGGDCPALTMELLARVAVTLPEQDVIIVPAVDGGYCLIAMRKLAVDLFRNISWSAASVLEETRARLVESGRSWCELATLEDVDDRASWRRAVAAFPELKIAGLPE